MQVPCSRAARPVHTPSRASARNFVPGNYDASVVDEVFRVPNDAAIAAARALPKAEGILIGISGGAALHAATELAKRPENEGKNIVVIFPDNGERYLSTVLYAD